MFLSSFASAGDDRRAVTFVTSREGRGAATVPGGGQDGRELTRDVLRVRLGRRGAQRRGGERRGSGCCPRPGAACSSPERGSRMSFRFRAAGSPAGRSGLGGGG